MRALVIVGVLVAGGCGRSVAITKATPSAPSAGAWIDRVSDYQGDSIPTDRGVETPSTSTDEAVEAPADMSPVDCLDTDPLHGQGIGHCTAQQK